MHRIWANLWFDEGYAIPASRPSAGSQQSRCRNRPFQIGTIHSDGAGVRSVTAGAKLVLRVGAGRYNRYCHHPECERGGTGRRTGFRFQRPNGHGSSTLPVRTKTILANGQTRRVRSLHLWQFITTDATVGPVARRPLGAWVTSEVRLRQQRELKVWR